MSKPTNVSRRSFLGKSPVAAVAIASVAVAAVPVAVAAGLIDVAKVRAALPRLFSGTWDEIIGELLQNAQRAGAKNVYVTMPDSGPVRELTFCDDGRGILGEVAGFQKLLAIGVSGWDDQVMQDQSPLGLGLHALLANESVLEVEIISGGLAIQIDRSRWWSDESYYGNWQSLLRPASGSGFRLRVKFQCDSTLLDYTVNSLKYSNNPLAHAHVAADGYADLLRIHINGSAVAVRQRRWLQDSKDTVEFMYDGCPVRIGVAPGLGYAGSGGGGTLLINWYGQCIKQAMDVPGGVAIRVEIIVRGGSPFTLQSPSRKGPVENAEWRRFCAAIVEKCREIVTASLPPALDLLQNVLRAYPQLQVVSHWLPVSDCNPATFSRVVSYASLQSAYVLPAQFIAEWQNWPDTLGETIDNDPAIRDRVLGEIKNVGHAVVMVPTYADWSRLQRCLAQVELLQPHADDARLPMLLQFYAAARVRILLGNKQVVAFDLVGPLAVVVATSYYDIDQAEGVIIAPSVIAGLQDVGGDFFSESSDYDRDSSEEQQINYDMSVSVLLAALQGYTDTMTADTQLPYVLAVLRDLPGAVLRPVWDNRSVSAIEVVQDGTVVRTITVVY